MLSITMMDGALFPVSQHTTQPLVHIQVIQRYDILAKLTAKKSSRQDTGPLSKSGACADEKNKNEDTLDDFRNGKINVIFASQVFVEGVGIRKWNLVLRFDPIPNYRSYIQSKGTARASKGVGSRQRFINFRIVNLRHNL